MLIGAPELNAMQAHAVLVNTARGAIVDTEALVMALEAGEIGAAGLDVYEAEPHVPDSLLAAPRRSAPAHRLGHDPRARRAWRARRP